MLFEVFLESRRNIGMCFFLQSFGQKIFLPKNGLGSIFAFLKQNDGFNFVPGLPNTSWGLVSGMFLGSKYLQTQEGVWKGVGGLFWPPPKSKKGHNLQKPDLKWLVA